MQNPDVKPKRPIPVLSHMMDGEYVALMETNGKECESWYYFIRKDGNEEMLKHLQDQLNQVEWYVLDDLSVYDLDLEHTVSAKTAKEMTKLELNSYAFHRKFDGKLKQIDLGFKKKDSNEKKMVRAFDHLGYGQIEDYIDLEDIDEEDLLTHTETESEDDESSCSEDPYASDSGSVSSKSSNENDKKYKHLNVPEALRNSTVPNWAKSKRHGK